MAILDLSSGLAPADELALDTPRDLYRYAENYMFTGYDPSSDVGIYLHLGTCPDDFAMWEDQVIIALPGDEGVMWMCSNFHTPKELRPGGANLRCVCVEPFRRWRITFSGRGVRSSNQEMRTQRLADGPKELFSFELDVECRTPAWDAHQSVTRVGTAAGSMKDQSWASNHYQQMYVMSGTLHLPGRDLRFEGSGVRDHSRGQRGHAYDRYGGHNLYSILFPSGRAFQLMQMWTPDGTLNLSSGYIVTDGELQYGQGLEASRLTAVLPPGEEVYAGLRTERGEHRLRGTVVKQLLATLVMPYGIAYGADVAFGRGTYSPSFGRWEWDGEVGYGFTERTARIGAQRA